MSYDFVIVGAGIGGLTTAALLTARGYSTCLLERQSQVGGCVGRVEFAGHDFEPGMGLYSSFGPGEIFEQIFSELKIGRSLAERSSSNYTVRLVDADFSFNSDLQFELKRVFPECAVEAIDFYDKLARIVQSPSPRFKLLRSFLNQSNLPNEPLLRHLPSAPRFRAFIEAQLRGLQHRTMDQYTLGQAAPVLNVLRSELYRIKGGISAVAELLEASIREAGGTVKLNSPVLRLSFNQSGEAVGVDLLSGETIAARRAIISNLTVWDTYGKLIGLNRTPPETKKQLAATEGSGAYLIYASMDEAALTRLPADHFLVAAKEGEFTFAVGTGKAPTGKLAVTFKTRTDVNDWFRFHSSDEDFEEWDQAALEEFWTRIHKYIPELGGDIEVIETANPRTFYDLTRRKLGMVLGRNVSGQISLPHRNLFCIGDTFTDDAFLHSIMKSAVLLANQLSKNRLWTLRIV